MKYFGEWTADILQLLFCMYVAVTGSDVVHIGNQHQPTFFCFAFIQWIFGILLFYDFQYLIRMQLIKQRQLVLQKQKNAFLMGRSSDMFHKFGFLVVSNRRRDFFNQLFWLLVKIILKIIDIEMIDPIKTFVFGQEIFHCSKDMINITFLFFELEVVDDLRNFYPNLISFVIDDEIWTLARQVFNFHFRIMTEQCIEQKKLCFFLIFLAFMQFGITNRLIPLHQICRAITFGSDTNRQILIKVFTINHLRIIRN